MSSTGDCFVVLPPHCDDATVIFGRNSIDFSAVDVTQEVHYYSASTSFEGETNGGLKPEASGETVGIILQKPKHSVWGGDYGANEKNVCIGIAYECGTGSKGDNLSATDIVRLALSSTASAASAMEYIGSLVSSHGADNAKISFIVCDPTEVWSVSCAGKLWAAQCFNNGCHRFPNDCLAVTNSFEKSCDGLGHALKSLGLWDGEGDLNFAACFGSAACGSTEWTGESFVGEGLYSLTNMFETLRSVANIENCRSSTVSVLAANRISCHWFTATPNARESVFKPFVFAPNPKISPLTKVPAQCETTLLHKLHAQRKAAAMHNLRALEAACVEEVNKYLEEHLQADEELDELMKDCVEAEVKFYR